MDLEDVAEELYGLDPGEFTPVRNAREKEARTAGDRDLAKRIKELRKPSLSAWLANQLVRARSEVIDPLLDLGEQLRLVQASVDAEQLRAMTQQRHRLVYAVAQEARGLARERGQAVSDDIIRELEQTLHAALGDPDAAEALRAGQLVHALNYAGFGPGGGAAVDRPAAPRPARKAPEPKDDLAERRRQRAEAAQRARAQAEEAIVAARAALESAEAEQRRAEEEVEYATGRHEAARDRIDQLRLDLDDAEQELSSAEHLIRVARKNGDTARRAAQQAAQRMTNAQTRLADLPEA